MKPVLGLVGPGDQGGAGAEARDRGGVAAVEAAGDAGLDQLGAGGDQRVDRRAVDGDKPGVAPGGRLLDDQRRVPDGIEEGVEVAAAEGVGDRLGADLRHLGEGGVAPAERRHEVVGERAGARALGAAPEALARKVLDAGDAGVGADDEGQRLGIERHHRAQVGERSGGGEGAAAGDGFGLGVGLDDGEVVGAVAQSAEVGDRAAGGPGGAAHAGLAAVLVDQAAEGDADREVDAGDAGRRHRHERGLGLGRGLVLRRAGGGQQRPGREDGDGRPGWSHARLRPAGARPALREASAPRRPRQIPTRPVAAGARWPHPAGVGTVLARCPDVRPPPARPWLPKLVTTLAEGYGRRSSAPT